jgi:hypothetical protein
VVIRGDESALAVDLVLSKWHFIKQLNRLVVLIEKSDIPGLIATSPDDQVRLLHMPLLFANLGALKQLYSLLTAVFDRLVESLGVASQPRERIKVAILVSKYRRFEFWIAVGISIGNLAVKYLDLVTVNDLNVPIFELGQLRVVEAGWLIFKEAEALANALAFLF